MLYGTPATAVWLWDDSAATYVDHTIVAQRLDSTPFTSLEQTTDFLYIGFSRRFDAVIVWLDTSGEYGNLKWEVSADGVTWLEVVPVQPREYLLSIEVDYVRWAAPETWVSKELETGSPPDSTARYWVRVSASGSITRPAIVRALTLRPYAGVASPSHVQAQLQLSDAFAADTLPSAFSVEQFIRGAEDEFYYLTGHYYRPEFVEDELVNFKAYGMTLRQRPVLTILEVAVHNGNDWEPKVEGRNQDWHYEPTTGLMYISTLFMDVVPPILRRGYSERRNQGAFKRGVRVRYVHGHSEHDPFRGQMQRIVTKQAAIDVITDRDFARLLPQGLDRVTLDAKTKLWREEIIEFKETYKKLYMV